MRARLGGEEGRLSRVGARGGKVMDPVPPWLHHHPPTTQQGSFEQFGHVFVAWLDCEGKSPWPRWEEILTNFDPRRAEGRENLHTQNLEALQFMMNEMKWADEGEREMDESLEAHHKYT